MQWKDVHSQSWPMTPDESQFGYTPTYVHGPLLAQPFGVPITPMAGRLFGGSRRQRKQRRKAARQRRRLIRHLNRFQLKRAQASRVPMQGMTMGALSVSELMELQQLQAKKEQGGQFTAAQSSRYTYLTTQYHSRPTTSKAPTAKPSDAATSSSVVAAPSGPAVPVWRAEDAEVVPQGRDGETYFRSLGFNRGDARRLAEHARAFPGQRGERRRMMDRFGAPMERRMIRQASRGGGGGGFDASGVARGVGDLFGGLFGRREQTQAADFGGGGQVAAEPARQGMSPLLIGGLAVAGLGAAYFLTQA